MAVANFSMRRARPANYEFFNQTKKTFGRRKSLLEELAVIATASEGLSS